MMIRRWKYLIPLLVVQLPLPGSGEYPTGPVTVVVAFGVGGSADRMARSVSRFVSDQLGEPIQVINRQGAGTLLGANYVLQQPDDGYTVLASSFSPYLINTILEGNASYTIDDFAYINFQWFDEDLIALHKGSRFEDLPQLLEEIRSKPKTVKASVVRGSAGHLMAKLLLEVCSIPQDHLNLVTYNSGGQARAAVAGGVVDFIVISAKGTETIRDYIRPLAIVSNSPNESWDVPPLNEALQPLGITAPILPGSIRGFATSAAFKQAYPDRFDSLVSAFEEALKDDELRALLNRQDIGGRWTGPKASELIMEESFEIFQNYSYLLRPNS